MTEKEDVLDPIVALLRRIGHLVIRVNQGRRGNVAFTRWYDGMDKGKTKGLPDLFSFAPNGIAWAIEVKQLGGKLSPEQELFKLSWLAWGGMWIAAYDVDDVAEWVNRPGKDTR